MRLYTYCLRYDDGAAPNPFWGICTLVICKPVVRRTAEIGDWIAGLGSSNSLIGDISDYLVYAMKVTNKFTMQEYDESCKSLHPKKIPQWLNRKNYRLRMGDCIYDYSEGEPPKLRWSVHNEGNRERDLGGKFALISKHFYYFGNNPIKLPDILKPIIHSTQGHKSMSNDPYINEFVKWIEGLGYSLNKLYGEPQLKSEYMIDDKNVQVRCAERDLEADEDDERLK